MPYNHATSHTKPYLNVNSANKSLLAMVGRLANQFSTKLGVATSLVATISLPNSSQVVHATNLTPSKDTANQNFTIRKTTSVLPRVDDKITSIATTQLILSTDVLVENSSGILTDGKKLKPNSASPYFNTVASLTKMPDLDTTRDFEVKLLPLYASSSLIAKTGFETYIVKPGDTVDRIARRYRVSGSELVKLNKINNSNIIFVNQRLRIPTKAIEENYANSTKLNSNKDNSITSTSTKEDPHIVKLKAEIEQMRIRERNSQRQKQTDDTVSNLPSLPSVGHHKRDRLVQKERKTPKQIAISTTPQYNLKLNLLPEEIRSLQLPPLPSSQEYLPHVFEGYIWPAQGVLTSGYGWRWGRLHRGIDIAAPVGTPVLAAASGKVINAGWHSGYGNLIKIEHLDGSITLYAHNNRILVSHGQQVEQGEQIGEMGSTGHSTGSHLHFEIHFKDIGAVNPSALLGGK